MKNRTLPSLLIGLVFCAMLALPVFAQDNANSTQAPATATQSSSQSSSQTSSAATTASGKQPLQPEAREGFWGRVNPFARKKICGAPDRTDSRAQQGIQMASAKAAEADQHATEAGTKAQAAQQTADQASTRLNTVEQVVTNLDQYQASTQTEIRFKPGQTVLSKNAKEALDEMATPLKTQRGYVVEVQGFSSGHGQVAIANSQKMAESVVRYLVLNHDIPVYRIYLVGMGNAPAPATTADGAEKPKRINGGRVEISLLKNNLEQLASTNSTADQQQK